jgi:hypothetical protein
LFVQVTVLPTGTVSVAGSNLKLSMVTALPATGAAGAEEEDVSPGAAVADGIPLIPGIPGVTLAPDPKVTVGGVLGAGEEQAASSRTVAVASMTARQDLIFTPTYRRAGYTSQVGWSGCGARTSITPLTSRTCSAGSGFGEIGS